SDYEGSVARLQGVPFFPSTLRASRVPGRPRPPYDPRGEGCLFARRGVIPPATVLSVKNLRRADQFRIHKLQPPHRLTQRDGSNAVAAQADQGAEFLLLNEVHGFDSVTRPQHAVEGRRGAPALNMPEDRDASLEARSLFNRPPDHFTNAAQVDVAELVELLILGHQVAVAGEFEPFGHHHNGEDAAARVALLKYLGDLFDGGRPFGDEDAIRAAGQASHGSDPARVPAHNFHNHDALVRLCGGMEPVNGLGDDRNCRVKTE